MKSKKRYRLLKTVFIDCFCILLILLYRAPAIARIEIFAVSSPPTPVGSGARAMGMGGAFVAVADDATAASWNPAGLIQLQTPEISGAFSWENRSTRRYSAVFSSSGEEQSDSASALNYLSFVYPFSLARRNMVFSLNFQKLYDFSKKMHINVYNGFEEFHSKGKLYTFSPALAIRISDSISFGLAINIWDKWVSNSGWENIYNVYTFPDSHLQSKKEEYKGFHGINANLGLLYRFTPKLTFGAVYKIPFKGKFDYTSYYSEYSYIDYGTIYGHINSIDYPAIYGLGISYRASDAWTISADVTRTQWSKFRWRNDRGEAFGLFSIDPYGQKVTPAIDPVYSIRLGLEYLKILEKTVIPFRAGLFYDPIPSVNHPHDEYGFSFGSGASLGDFILDFAYQYRVRHDVQGRELGVREFSYIYEDRRQHLLLFSTIYHF